MNNNIFSDEELKIILEALLFSSNVDVCASFYKEDAEKMFNLAKKIRQNCSVPIENVYINEIKNLGFLDEETANVLKFFPELQKKESEI